MSKIKVKAGKVTNLTDARYFAAREVEWLGFRIGNGQEMISLADAKAIAAWVDGVEVVGEFGFATPAEIMEWCTQAGIRTIQVGMFSELEEIRALTGLSVIKEVVVGVDFTKQSLKNHLNAFYDHCDFFLLDFFPGSYRWSDVESGNPFDTGFLKEICQDYRIIFNLDCPADNIAQMLELIRPYGIQLNGAGEEKVGMKSFDELDEIFDALETE